MDVGRKTGRNARRRSGNVEKKGDTDGDPKGAIPFPCCPKEKVMVFAGAHGCSSIKCPNCGKYSRFDYDSLSAEISGICRGASRKLSAAVHTT